MAASPNKALIGAAHRALALLNPEWQIAADLRAALESAQTVKAAPKRKSWKIPYCCGAGDKPYSPEAWRALTYADTHGVNPNWPKDKKARKWKDNGKDKFIVGTEVADTQAAERAKLALCACGHKADEHAKDELENLLKCSHNLASNGPNDCHCDHFHYGADSAQREAA